MVFESPAGALLTFAGHKGYRAQKHADAMLRHRSQLVTQIGELEKAQDELLERLFAEI